MMIIDFLKNKINEIENEISGMSNEELQTELGGYLQGQFDAYFSLLDEIEKKGLK